MFNDTPTEERLAREILAANGTRGDWIFEARDRRLRNTKTGALLSLGNLFTEYSNAEAAARPALVLRYLGLLRNLETAIPVVWTTAEKGLYPVLRSRYSMLAIEIDLRDSGTKWSPLVTLPFHGELTRNLVYDLGTTVHHVSTFHLDDWGVTANAAWERALRNLYSLPKPAWREIAPKVWRLDSPGGYHESMLLRPDVRAALQVRGVPHFLATNRNVLLATGNAEPAGIAHLLGVARKFSIESPWPLPPVLLRAEGARFEPVTLTGLELKRFQSLQRIDRATVYNEQKTALAKWLERTKRDVFVASYQVGSSPNDPDDVRDVTYWTQGVHSWLPQAQTLVLNRIVGNQMQTAILSWKQVEAVCGGLMRKLDEDPVRFEVRDFPDAAQWQQLAAVAQSVTERAMPPPNQPAPN